MGKLEHKVAIVTGASKGIGASIARHLAAEGAAVVVNYAASREGADRVGADIARAGGRAVAIHGDLARPADVDRLFAETAKAFGRLDILVNNAGIYEFRPLEEITPEHFHQHFDLNVLGVLLASRAAAAHFGAAGGSIVNISSGATTLIPANSAVYTVTKAALDAITGVLAKELGPRGIRVDAVNPGMVDTEGVRAAGFDQSDLRKDVESRTPLGRIGRPEDIAPAVVFLAGEDSGWTTGETLLIAGGLR
ncbi:MAG TPA: glucose 1-dehydrogenase [Verrucomicrobiae bacterium]|jgi:3-oxoacyl-[acyl-carrier protein] reductase|nr:glucose 1-dehydrogenase [Verrucomicrobiae bacterium]